MSDGTLQHYRTIMADEVRMSAYARAISAVCPDKTVCEIGVGLGPLSLLALKAGARRVYGIEVDPAALDIARRVIASHGYGADRFVPIPGLSHRVDLPERVDVVISEVLNSVALGENALFYLADARQRFLTPGGAMLPAALRCHAALGASSSVGADLDFWERQLLERYGMDYSEMSAFVRAGDAIVECRPEELSSRWQPFADIDFLDAGSYAAPSPLVLDIERASRVTGLFTAFEAQLGAGVSLSTLPGAPATHWKQGFCPFKSPLDCAEGDRVAVQIVIPRSETPRVYLEAHARKVPRETGVSQAA